MVSTGLYWFSFLSLPLHKNSFHYIFLFNVIYNIFNLVLILIPTDFFCEIILVIYVHRISQIFTKSPYTAFSRVWISSDMMGKADYLDFKWEELGRRVNSRINELKFFCCYCCCFSFVHLLFCMVALEVLHSRLPFAWNFEKLIPFGNGFFIGILFFSLRSWSLLIT